MYKIIAFIAAGELDYDDEMYLDVLKYWNKSGSWIKKEISKELS